MTWVAGSRMSGQGENESPGRQRKESRMTADDREWTRIKLSSIDFLLRIRFEPALSAYICGHQRSSALDLWPGSQTLRPTRRLCAAKGTESPPDLNRLRGPELPRQFPIVSIPPYSDLALLRFRTTIP